MSSVAVATGTPVVAHRSEADIVRSAARADRDAFDELYRRHHQTSWRLSQAVSADADAAGVAVAKAFAVTLRAVRRQRSLADQPFRPQVLAATYQAGMEPNAGAAAADDVPSALLAAFRSLPDRWRAALWLSEVEHLDPATFAAVLGVSAPVAAQLAERGRHGLLTRLGQVGVATPDHLDRVLRPLAGSPPDGLEALVAKRWRSAVTVDASGRLVPVSEWLARRAPRPLWTACGGLVALGMVGLGVLTVSSPPATTGPAAAIAVPGLTSAPPLNPMTPSPLFAANPSATGAVLAAATIAAPTTALGGNPILIGEGSPAAMTATATTTPAKASTPASSGGSTSSGGTTPTGGTTTPTGGSKTPASSSGSTTVVQVPGVATVTTPSSGGGVSATIGSPAAPVATIVATPTCTGLQVLNVITNSCVTAPATSLGSAVSGTATGLLGGLGIK